MTIRFTLPVLLSALALPVAGAHAGERDSAVAGALIGGAAGAALGHHLGGRDGAVVVGAIGAATGAAVATAPRDPARGVEARGDSGYDRRDAYAYRDYDEDDDVRVRTRVVYDEPVVRERVIYREAPPVVVYRPAPVVVYRDAPVYYQPVRQVVRYDVPAREWRGHGRDKHRMKEYYKWRRHHDRGHDRDDD